MRSELKGLLLAFGFAFSLLGVRQASAQDLASPKATVRSFIAAMNKKDKAAMQQCIQGETRTDLLTLLFGSDMTSLDFEAITLLEERDGDHARVAAEYILKFSNDSKNAGIPPLTLVDLMTLEKKGERWLLVLDPAVNKAAKEGGSAGPLMALGQTRILSFAVALATSPEMVKAVEHARDSARAVSCLSNMKQIATGMMMYAQDYDEHFLPKGASLIDKIMPYIKNKEIFTCPLDPPGTVSYTFNSGLAGVTLAMLEEPARTVMIYEGKGGKLDYKHDGQAHVGFADGHVKAIKPEEAAGLIWTVKTPPPPPAKPVKKKKQR